MGEIYKERGLSLMVGKFSDVSEVIKDNFENLKIANGLENIRCEDIDDENLGDYVAENTDESYDDADDESLEDYIEESSHELYDDAGKEYKTEDGELLPNNTFVLDGITYKTDDNGEIYCVDGKLKPNTTYELNGNVYTTDEKGRIIRCEAKPTSSPENPRDNDAQRKAGYEDRKPNDQGGHIIGRDMNGDGGIGNLIAMDSKINQSDYKRMENDIKAALADGKEVTTKTEITYSDDSDRPDKITVTTTVDGKKTVYKFDNNIDGSLRNEVPENGKEVVKSRLEETGGEISSIKEEYDENGNLVQTTVYITYKGEDGNNYRTSVVIENK